jgi:hypothetical protein
MFKRCRMETNALAENAPNSFPSPTMSAGFIVSAGVGAASSD